MCVRNYNSGANNKDVITVDYVITGGRQSGSICVQEKTSIENETLLNKRNSMELKLHKEGAKIASDNLYTCYAKVSRCKKKRSA